MYAIVVASTLAWFTDSVGTSGNKIQAGDLKIDLQVFDKEAMICGTHSSMRTNPFLSMANKTK